MNLIQKRLIILSAGLLFLIACARDKKPGHVLSEKEMLKVLREFYLAEEKTSRLSINRDSSIVVFDSLQRRILKDAGIPDTVFKTSLDYYWNHPQKLEGLYATLIDSLNLYEQRLLIPMKESE